VKTMIRATCLTLALFLINTPLFAGEDSHNLVTMATIVNNLNHHPSDSEKTTLEKIVNDSTSATERVIATSLINLNHKASGPDKAELEKIMNDSGASENSRTLATIIHSLNHQPSASDREQLAGITNGH